MQAVLLLTLNLQGVPIQETQPQMGVALLTPGEARRPVSDSLPHMQAMKECTQAVLSHNSVTVPVGNEYRLDMI